MERKALKDLEILIKERPYAIFVMQTQLLYDIADMLDKLSEDLSRLHPRGLIHHYSLKVGRDLVVVKVEEDIKCMAFSLNLHNDGPDDLYVTVNGYLLPETPIKPNESFAVDFHEGKIAFVVLKSDGLSTVRMWVGY